MPRNANQSKQSNYSMDFDGTGDYIDLGNADSLKLRSGDFTFSAWINPDSWGSGYEGIYVNAAGNGVWIGNGGNGNFVLRIYGFSNIIAYSTLPTINTWTHICITRNSGLCSLFYNGSSVATATSTHDFNGSANVFIGSDTGGADFDGKITELCIFDYALSSSQVTTLWGGGTSVSNPMALARTPIAYYPLGKSAWNGNFLTENNAIGDYVFSGYPGGTKLINTNINKSNTGGKFTFSVWQKYNGSGFLTFNHGGGAIGEFRFFGAAIVYLAPAYYQYFDFSPSTAASNPNWQHWVIFVDTTNVTNSKFWVDGVPISKTGYSTGTSANTFTSGLQINIGGYPLISNMMYFVDYEIDQANVDKLYNYGSPLMSTETLTQAPDAWYKFDASEIYDSSNTQWQIANNVLSNKAYSFNGTSNIEIAQNSSIQTSNFSIGLWIKGYPQLDKTIIENGGANGFSIKTKHDDATKVLIRTGGVDGLTLTGALNGEWNFVYFTMSGNISRGGINGAYGNDGGAARNYDSSKGLFIGSKSDSTSGFTGEIAQVVYYDERGPNNATGLYGNLPANPPPNPLVGEANPNLVSWWKLDAASITDSEGSNNGTNNGATLIDTNVGRPAGIGGLSSGMNQSNLVQSDLQTVAPYSKYAMNFDGTDYIETNGSVGINIGNTFTTSAWVNLTGFGGAIFGGTDYVMFIVNSGEVRIKFYGFSKIYNSLTTTLSTGEWYHFLFVRTGETGELFINGVSQGPASSLGINDFQFKYIGARATSLQLFNGKISNAAIWNIGLSDPQVKEIYNQGLPSNLNTFSGTAPIHWWQLGENSSYVGGATNPWTFADEIVSNNATSGNLPQTALVNGVGTTANGTSTGMSEGSLVGDAPYSTANAISSGMALTARGPNVP